MLTFGRASDELAGVYECQAENSLGTARSAPATVEVFCELLCLAVIDVRIAEGCAWEDGGICATIVFPRSHTLGSPWP